MEHKESTTVKSNASVQKPNDATPYTTGEQNRASFSQQATQTKEAIKSAAVDTAANVKQQARQTANDARQAVSEIATDAKESAMQTANDMLGDMRTRANSLVDERKAMAADRLHSFADALRQTGSTLQDRQEESVAGYANAAADQIEKFSGYLRQQDIGNVLQEVQNFARRQPEVFVAGTLAAGFLLGRLFKSSSSSSNQAQWNQSYNQGYGQRYGQSGGMYGAQQYNQSSGSGYTGSGYSSQYGAAEYQRQYGSSDYSGQSGSRGMSGQSGASGYEGQAGLSREQYTRQGQTDWANAAGTPGQMPSGTGTLSAAGEQTDDASGRISNATEQSRAHERTGNSQDRSNENKSAQLAAGPAASGQPQTNQQNKGGSGQDQSSSTRPGNTGRKEE